MILIIVLIIASGLMITFVDVQEMKAVDTLLDLMLSNRREVVNAAESIIWGPKTVPLNADEIITDRILEAYFAQSKQKAIPTSWM